MNRLLFFILLLSISNATYAQSFSNKGTDFWVGYGYHVRMVEDGGQLAPINSQEMILYFAVDQLDTHITVSIPGIGWSQAITPPTTVPAVVTSNVMPKNGSQDARLLSEGVLNKGIHITSDKPIVAYSHIYNSRASGATILFPTNTLGKTYYSINFTNQTNEDNSHCFFYAVATDTGTTTLRIVPSKATLTHPAGVPFTVNLSQGQIFNALGQLNGSSGGNNFTAVDLTGSKIESIASVNGECKRIAVFSGSGKINISCGDNGQGGTSSDNYMVQNFPKDAWGKKFLTSPTQVLDRNLFRVCVSDPAAIVKVNNQPITNYGPLTSSFYYEISATNSPLKIESNIPITVSQYISSSGGCSNPDDLGDPEVIYLSPVEQNISDILWNATPNEFITNHYVNAIIPNGGTGLSSFRFDGAVQPIGAFTIHPQDPNYSIFSKSFVNTNNRTYHTAKSDSGFNAIAYGFGSNESYGYNAGTNIKDLYNFATPISSFADSISGTKICAGTPFYFTVTFPFIPTFLNFNFNDPNIPNQNYATQSQVDALLDITFIYLGKQVWVYKLPTTIAFGTPNINPGQPVWVTAGTASADGCGNSIEKVFYVEVNEAPDAHFGWLPYSGCLSDAIQFKDSTNYSGGVVPFKWFWDFGDGQFSNLQNPTHQYTSSGTYTLKFHIVSNIGCLSDTIIRRIAVSQKPTATITNSTPTCFNSPVTFTGLSLMTLPDTLKKWIWYFGDNSTTTTNSGNISHAFQDSAFFTPSVVLVSNSGCRDSVVLPIIEVSPKPLAGFISPDACLLDPFVQFIDTTRFPQNTVPGSQLWKWTFGDGDTSILQNPQHIYTTIGYKDVKLWVTNQSGCKDSITQRFYIGGAKPDPSLNLLNTTVVCDKDSVYIKNTSTISLGDIIRVNICWDTLRTPSVIQTDNTPSLNQVYAFKYPQTRTAETYYIKLTVSSGGSCLDSTNVLPITIHPNPDIDFTQDKLSACLGDVVSLTDRSTDYEGGLQHWYWNMGDNNTVDLSNHTYVYNNPGEYQINYVVKGINGCLSDTLSTNFKVYPYPDVEAGEDLYVLEGNSAILPGVVNGNGVSFYWTPTQYLTYSNTLNPTCTPVDDITYTLVASADGGCRREDRIKVTVLKVPGIPNTFSPNRDGINDKWEIKYLDQYPYAKVQVFTRTGQKIFESLGYKQPWDGTFKGKSLPVDTYYYVIEPESGRKPVTGYVTIIK